MTELVSGQDLVAHMLNVAAGRPVPDHLLKDARPLDNGKCKFVPMPFKGWAIESRVYAEDPER